MKAILFIALFLTTVGCVRAEDNEYGRVQEAQVPFAFLRDHLELLQVRQRLEPNGDLVRREFHALFNASLLPIEILYDRIFTKGYLGKGGPILRQTCAPDEELRKASAEIVVNDQPHNCWNVDLTTSETSGRVFAVWQDERNGVNNPDIYGQLFDLNFTPVGKNFRVHSEHAGAAQMNPSVCAASDGGFVIVWEDYRSGGSRVYCRLLDGSGAARGKEFPMSWSAGAQLKPDVACDGSGRCIIAWLQNDDGDYNLYACRLMVNNGSISDVFRVNDDQESLQWFPSVASLPSGETLMVWEDKREGGSHIYGQRLRADGSKRAGNFRIDDAGGTLSRWRPQVAAGASRFVVVWEDDCPNETAVYVQFFDANLIKDGINMRIGDAASSWREWPTAALNAINETVVCWQQRNGDQNNLCALLLNEQKQPSVYGCIARSQAGDFSLFPRINLIGKHSMVFYIAKGATDSVQKVKATQVFWEMLPVELVAFEAIYNNGAVRCRWRTESESNNYGFVVQRKNGDSAFQETAFIPGFGTSSEPHVYEYIDRPVSPGVYTYRLKQIDFDGSTSYSESVLVIVDAPSLFALFPNFPNPFNGETILSVALPREAFCSLVILTADGRTVRTLVEGPLPAGERRFVWDGRDDDGRPAASGLYFARLTDGVEQRVIKMTTVK